MPGRHINDHQTRLYMKQRQTQAVVAAAQHRRHQAMPPQVLVDPAALSHDLLVGRLPSLGRSRIRAAYRERLYELGLVSEGGSLRQNAIHIAFHDRFGR